MTMMKSRSFRRCLPLACLLIVAVITVKSVSALYDFSLGVEVFESPEAFDGEVMSKDAVWMIHLFDPSSQPCQALAARFNATSAIVKGVIRMGAVDVTTTDGKAIAAGSFGLDVDRVSTYPILYIVGHDRSNLKPHKGGMEAQDLVQAALNELVQTFQARSLEFGFIPDPEKKGRAKQQQQQQRQSKGKTNIPSRVVQLDESNYQEIVMDSPKVAMVAFVAPWCGHCKALLPEWEEAAQRLEDEDIIVGVVDATVEKQLANLYGVKGYPTIKVFPGGAGKSHTDALDYNGERSAQALVKYAADLIDQTAPPKEIPELTSQEMLEEMCGGANRICLLAALPHLLDSGVDGRNKYRDLLAVVAKRFRGTAFRFLWMEAGAQYDLEQVLELTFGYPAVVALSLERRAYAVFRGSFRDQALGGFLGGITSGRQSTIPLSQALPAVVEVEPWDGQEAKPLEEEIPLSEIMGWDDEEEGEL